MMKSKYRFNALLFALLAALLVTSVAGAAPKDGAVVSLSVQQSAFDSSQDVLVAVTISNPTRHTVRVLKWFTPVDGVEEPLFAVTRDGEPVAYIGAHYKRPDATGKDYISLKAGESLTSTVNLGEYYDLSASGQYEISYAVASFNLFDEKGNAFRYRDTLTSEKVSASLEGRAPKGRPTPPPPPPPGGNAFNACTDTQIGLIEAARVKASEYAVNAESYLLGNNQGPRYTTWFGVYSLTRFNKVTSNFTKISDAMDTIDGAGINFDCKCKQPYYAYVYPNDPYKIYLCKVFWQAPPAGTDSQAGTLIHEMSHFDVVAATDDVVYGQSGAMNLASSDPNLAVTNADSHEYFAENTPFRP
jgi:peptidyl-Lys metalloendopeptidase